MSSLQVFPQKSPEESRPFVFDFTSQLVGTDTLSTAAASITVWSGVDANPSAMLVGGATVSGAQASQWLQGGVAGVVYKVEMVAHTAGTQTLVIVGLVAVVEDPL